MKDTTSVSDEEYAKRKVKMAEFQKEKIDPNSSFILDCFVILYAERAISLTEIDKNFWKEVNSTKKTTLIKKQLPELTTQKGTLLNDDVSLHFFDHVDHVYCVDYLRLENEDRILDQDLLEQGV